MYLCIPSGMDRTAAVHELPVLCGSALASYLWLLAPVFVACSTAPVFVACSTNANGGNQKWNLPPISYGKAHLLCSLMEERAMKQCLHDRNQNHHSTKLYQKHITHLSPWVMLLLMYISRYSFVLWCKTLHAHALCTEKLVLRESNNKSLYLLYMYTLLLPVKWDAIK